MVRSCATVEDLPLLYLLGVRPVWVDDLRTDALILIEDRLVLIRTGLDSCRVSRVIDQVLTAAAESLPVARSA